MEGQLLASENHTALKDIVARALLIVSEVRFLREGISGAVNENSKFKVAVLCETLDQALAAIRAHPAATVLLDAAFPNGSEALGQIRAIDATACIVVFAVSETEENIITWAKAGAAGYIPKTAALCELVRFVDCINRGEQICSTSIASRLIRRIGTSTGPLGNGLDLDFAKPLTTREFEIMRMISEGLSNKEIARELRIALSTAKSHVHNILAKLKLRRRGQVAQWVRRQETALG